MARWKNILFNVLLSLNVLLLFLLLFENRIVLPSWVQVAGRMHPLILHFPIVLIIIYVVLKWFTARQVQTNEALANTLRSILLFAALSAVITALMGLFLSREPGYDPDTLTGHKWSGFILALLTLAWYYFDEKISATRVSTVVASLLSVVLVVVTGHLGANITHGEDFLLAPVKKDDKPAEVALKDALVYAHMVKPVLESKCMKCHNAKKAKGELVMDTEALLLKGGKSGALWDSTKEDYGLMLRRIHLPADQKKHMPPQGKPQLTDDEIEIIAQWIKKGASFKLKVDDLAETDPLRVLAANMFKKDQAEEYDFAAADDAAIEKLNTVNCVVAPEAMGSPALAVSFFVTKFFDAAQLKQLLNVKKQVVSLDLAKMPVKDEDLKTISQLENLRKLNLNFTDITGASLNELAKLRHLHSLSLSGTNINAEKLLQLKGTDALRTMYLANIPLAAGDLQKLKQHFKSVTIETGYRGGDTTILKLTPPILQNEESVISKPVELKLKHYVKGAVIRYTTDESDPDSLRSPVYKPGILVSNTTTIKARAYKPGWIASDSVVFAFFKTSFTPDSCIFITQPDPAYKGSSKMLIDHQKGSSNFRLGNWLAWRETKMEVMLQFAKPQTIQSVLLGSLIDPGSHLMAPMSVEVWGGTDPARLTLLKKITPEQIKESKPAFLKAFDCSFSPVALQYIKVVAVPLNRLPSWHPQKGAKAWFFIDEVLIN